MYMCMLGGGVTAVTLFSRQAQGTAGLPDASLAISFWFSLIACADICVELPHMLISDS